MTYMVSFRSVSQFRHPEEARQENRRVKCESQQSAVSKVEDSLRRGD